MKYIVPDLSEKIMAFMPMTSTSTQQKSKPSQHKSQFEQRSYIDDFLITVYNPWFEQSRNIMSLQMLEKWQEWWQPAITLSQTTNFRLFQTERV